MARRAGDRNRDYEPTRQAILARLHGYLVPPRERIPSLRDLAQAARVSMPTLRHYLGPRDAIISAVMAYQGELGAPYLGHLAETDLPFAESIRDIVLFLSGGLFEARVSDIHAFGLIEGMQSREIGPRYLGSCSNPRFLRWRSASPRISRGARCDRSSRVSPLCNSSRRWFSPRSIRAISVARISAASTRRRFAKASSRASS